MSKVMLGRHGVTPNNEAGIWTGLTDIDMSERGYAEVEQGAGILAKYTIHAALCSDLMRARRTAQVILGAQANPDIPLLHTPRLNEKDYGIFTGKSKQQVRKEVGEEEFMRIRRSWDYRIPGGQSLQDVHQQVMPVYNGVVIPLLQSGSNVLIASHNNTLRAVVKEIEGIPDERASEIELGTAEIRVYDYTDGAFTLEERHVIGEVH